MWPHTSVSLPSYLYANKDRMNRAVAHLSYDRLNYVGEDKNWYPEPLLQEIGDK